jgi:arylsulfatase A-like enzyme
MSTKFLLACLGTSVLAAQTPVIVISIDTLRADHLSSYGYKRIQTPNIDSFGEGGTTFNNAQCQIPLTLPSHASLFTSTYPFENRIEENGERVPAGAVTLATVLKSHGYKTAGLIGSVFLERQMGLDRGFDFYDSPFSFEAFSRISGSLFYGGVARNSYSVRDRRDGALVVRGAVQWLAANHGQPVFLFVHLFDLHEPRDVPPIAGYDAKLEYVDHLLGSFKQSLIRGGWWDKSLVVLLSDHGESLGEHGEHTHGYFIYQSTAWVPLMFHWPAGSSGHAARVENPVGLIDVAPAILEFLHIPAPPSFEGRSLLSDDPQRAVFAESVYSHDAFGWAPLRSLRAGSLKYIQAPKPELYDLSKDPHELSNLFAKNPTEALPLRRRLESLLARYAPKQPDGKGNVSPETKAALGSLGYLSAGPQSSGSGADPKDRLPQFQLYEKAENHLLSGQLDAAIAILKQILSQDPKNLLVQRDLGVAYVAKGLYAQARAVLEQVAATAPDDYVGQYELGLTDEHLGMLKEAREHLRAACAISPGSQQCRKELEAVEEKLR